MLLLGNKNDHNHCYQYVGRDDMYAIHRCKCGAEILQDIGDYYNDIARDEYENGDLDECDDSDEDYNDR